MIAGVALKPQVRTHSKTPYNLFEHIGICEIGDQIKIDAMDDQRRLRSIEYPKPS